MTDDLRDKWNRRYAENDHAPAVAAVLRDHAHLLPGAGRALDLACGRGANALFLAQQGLEVDAWDLADVAIDALMREASQRALMVHACVRDVIAQPPPAQAYDVIVVSHFHAPSLCPALVDALCCGGLLFYQTWSRTRVDDSGPRNPDFRLRDNELLQQFAALRVRVYREEGRLGDLTRGFRNQAMFVGEKVMHPDGAISS